MKSSLIFTRSFAISILTLLLPHTARSDEWKPLFDGRSLDGWQGKSELWTVQGGELVGSTGPDGIEHNTFLISERSYGDFVLELDFKLENGAVTEIRISRKGREAKRAPDGSIMEYGFFNGAILPDLYFGMQPSAIQEHLGPPLKTEAITPMGADGFNERHVYDGLTLEYDRWSNDKLVLGAAILTKSATASANTDKILDAMNKKAAQAAESAKRVRPTKEPR